MCGIFGYVGTKENTAELILAGLRQLEYRGYDSWGIAVKEGKTLEVDKHVGKIGDAKINLPQSNLGIGHTRWATHGGVTEANAHPHLDCTKQIAVVHNGIIENFAEIKDELIQKGHTFLSETDTEVIPHLIEEHVKTEGFATSVRDTFNSLHGLNAIVVVNAVSKEIIAAKNGSPLIAGKAEDGLYIASDAAGIIKHTRNVLFLKDDEMVILGDGVKLIALKTGEQLEPRFETVDWQIEQAQKGDFAHFMLKEIHEQPTVIRNIAENYSEQVEKLAKRVNDAFGTFFIAAGTAHNACLTGVYLFSKLAHKHVNNEIASEFNYLEDFLQKESLIIALSQSGETIDVIEPLNRAKAKGSKVVAITNVLGSTIYRMADHKLLLGAGPETAVASTKAYIAKLAVLHLLTYTMIDRRKEGEQELLIVANEVERLLLEDNVKAIEDIADKLKKSEHIYVVGRGVSYPSALEAALKIKEVSYIPTEGLAGGELKHGTIALIDKGTPCIVFAPKDESYDAMISNAIEIRSRGGTIIGISSEPHNAFDYFFQVNDSGNANVIAQIIPAQLLAYYLAVKKGYDPDKPRNLAKSVTVK